MKRLVAYRLSRVSKEQLSVMFDSFNEVVDFAEECGINLPAILIPIVVKSINVDMVKQFILQPRRKKQIEQMDGTALLSLLNLSVHKINLWLASPLSGEMKNNRDKVIEVLLKSSEDDLSEVESFGVYIDDTRSEARDMKQYIIDNADLQPLDALWKEIADNFENEESDLPMNAQDLKNNGDKKGDIIHTDRKFSVDIGSRETPFVYVNGKIKIGTDTDTHSNLINELLEVDIADTDYIRDDRAIHRTGDDNIGFGHISDNIGFIEHRSNSSEDEIASELSKQNLDKIYVWKKYDNELKRVAKRLVRR